MAPDSYVSAAAPLPIGIHFGLDEDRYHEDPGLGSTDGRKLKRNPSDYWYGSWMNPQRPADNPTPAKVRGRAMHKLVYEGEAAFDAIYARGVEKGDAAASKAANAAIKARGLIPLPADDYDRVAVSAAMITKNPELKSVFTGGFAEVSIIYERDGVRRKGRFDYLKPRGIGDLKGCANTRKIAFPAACRNDIVNFAYHEQASWYFDARAELPRLVADGAVYGDHDAELLRRIAKAPAWGWQWIFFQQEGAPITWSAVLSPQNPVVEVGRAANEEGIANYKRYMERFGPNEMWLLIERPQELAMEELPPWFGR